MTEQAMMLSISQPHRIRHTLAILAKGKVGRECGREEFTCTVLMFKRSLTKLGTGLYSRWRRVRCDCIEIGRPKEVTSERW